MYINGMYLAFILWRDFHIILVEVFQVGVRVVRSRKFFSFKGHAAQREDGVFAVHDAVSVVDKDIGHVGIFGIKKVEQSPEGPIETVFGMKPEVFGKGTQGIVMCLVQDGVAGRNAFGQFFTHDFGTLG